MNGDGHPDVVIVKNLTGDVLWFENPGTPDGKWEKHLLDGDIAEARTIRVADLDGNGRPDILAQAERGSNDLRWWQNLG